MSATVYRMYDEGGRLLYVGCSAALPTRLMAHATQRPWWTEVCTVTVEHLDTLDEAFTAEGRAQAIEHPIYNQRVNGPRRRWPSQRPAPVVPADEVEGFRRRLRAISEREAA